MRGKPATIVLWAIAVYFVRPAEEKAYAAVVAFPAMFMTAVSVTYR
ncbi:MAG: hypothetical protein ACLU61_00140 [Lachnospiraceae bacterium]